MNPRTTSSLTRAGLLAVAIAGLTLTAAEIRDHRRQRNDLAETLARSDLPDRQPEAAVSILRDVDPFWGRLRLARALVLEAMDPTSLGDLSPRQAALEAARAPLRLIEARRLAEQAVAERPVVWQAWLFRGAATYMEWFRALDERLFNERHVWEAPLEQAVALAPERAEPRRVVAGIAIDLWPTYDETGRENAREQVRAAFEHLPTLQRFAVAWLTVADEPFGVIPEDADSWAAVREAARRLGDWPHYCEAWMHCDRIRKEQAASLLSRAEWLVRHGERRMARRLLVDLIGSAPPGVEWSDEVERAVGILPAGIAGRETGRAFEPWLELALAAAEYDLELVSPDAVSRLASGVADLSPPDEALVALLAGRPEEAERITRRHDDLNTERWARYGLVRTRQLLASGDKAAAARTWALVHPSVREGAAAQDVRARFEVGLANEAAVVEDAGLRPATAWRWRRGQVFTDLPVTGGPTEVRISWDVVPANGAVVEVSVDFGAVWRGEVRPGESTEIRVDGQSKPAHIRVRALAGGRVVPGMVEWWPEGGAPLVATP